MPATPASRSIHLARSRFVRTRTKTAVDAQPAAAFLFLTLIALALVSGEADARSCGMMKSQAHMGMPMYPPRHPMPQGMPRGPGYGPGTNAWPSVLAVAKRTGEFTTLIKAVEAAGLTGLLEGDGPFTLFAPTDAAFKELPEGALEGLLADKAKLAELLKYHVVPKRVSAVEILTSRTLQTAAGQTLPTDDLSVIRADIPARNGVIQVVDGVLLPAGG
jgi:hypothetical protein